MDLDSVLCGQEVLGQVHRLTSQAHIEGMLHRHAYPTFGDRQISTILPSEVQAWVLLLGTSDKRVERRALAPETISVIHSVVSAIMRSAVRDRKIIANPCEGTRLPSKDRKPVIPLTTGQVDHLRELMRPELQALVTFTAGTGMASGRGLRSDSRPHRLPTTRGTGRSPAADPTWPAHRVRATEDPGEHADHPLPQVVVDPLAAHSTVHPVGEHDLVLIPRRRAHHPAGLGHIWRPVARAVGLEPGTGMHALRQYYASLLIRFGESVKTVQVRLGHASAAETLDTYSHLWPDSDDRTRAAVDSVLGQPDGGRSTRILGD